MKVGIQEELLLLNFLDTFLYKIAEWQVIECECLIKIPFFENYLTKRNDGSRSVVDFIIKQ